MDAENLSMWGQGPMRGGQWWPRLKPSLSRAQLHAVTFHGPQPFCSCVSNPKLAGDDEISCPLGVGTVPTGAPRPPVLRRLSYILLQLTLKITGFLSRKRMRGPGPKPATSEPQDRLWVFTA